MASTQPRHVLRRLLDLVKTPPLPQELLQKHSTTQAQYNNNIRRLLLKENRLRTTQLTTDGAKETKTRQDKEQYHRLSLRYQELLENLKERQRLYDLDRGAEERLSPKELSRRAAARAGLRLPDLSSSSERE